MTVWGTKVIIYIPSTYTYIYVYIITTMIANIPYISEAIPPRLSTIPCPFPQGPAGDLPPHPNPRWSILHTLGVNSCCTANGKTLDLTQRGKRVLCTIWLHLYCVCLFFLSLLPLLSLSPCLYIFIKVSTYICICIYLSIYLSPHIYIYIYVHIYVWTYIVHIDMHTHV